VKKEVGNELEASEGFLTGLNEDNPNSKFSYEFNCKSFNLGTNESFAKAVLAGKTSLSQ